MDPIAENLLVKLVLKSLNEADVAALFAETNAVRQVLEPIADDEDMRPVVTVMAYPEKPELRDSSWVDALRGVRERLAELAAIGGPA